MRQRYKEEEYRLTMDAPAESKNLGEKTEEISVDHFKRLPEGIVHRILSLLEARDVAITSVLSKTWYNWFSSFPYVECFWQYIYGMQVDDQQSSSDGNEIHDEDDQQPSDGVDEIHEDDQEFTDDADDNEMKDDQDSSSHLLISPEDQHKKKIDFLNLVKSSLKARLQRLLSTGTRIRSFKFGIVFDNLDLLSPCLDDLVALALEGDVEELDLNLIFSISDESELHYDVPRSVFLHKTLTTLKLQNCTFALKGEHNEVDIVKLPHLRKMNFVGVEFRGSRAVHMLENLAASFPCIEELELQGCDGFKTIHSASSIPQLKHVVLTHLDSVKMVHLLSPNLLTFSFVPYYEIDDDQCDLNLPTSLLLKELKLSRVRIGASLQKLLRELSSVMEVLKLQLCVFTQDTSTSLSLGHLKEVLLVDCTTLSNDENIDCPSLISGSANHLDKVHIVFPTRTTISWSKWTDFLMKVSVAEDLKLVVYDRENVVIHENLSKVSASTLCDLQDHNLRIWITSISCLKLLNILLFRTFIKTLSVVCRRADLKEMLLNTTNDYRAPCSVYSGAELVTQQDQISCSALKDFLKEYSTAGYDSTTFILKFKKENTYFTTDNDWLNHMFKFFESSF